MGAPGLAWLASAAGERLVVVEVVEVVVVVVPPCSRERGVGENFSPGTACFLQRQLEVKRCCWMLGRSSLFILSFLAHPGSQSHLSEAVHQLNSTVRSPE